MTQDDMPAPAVVDEEKAVREEENPLVEYVPPTPATPTPALKSAKTEQSARRSAAAPDPFAVGVRVLKMAPAWLLFTAVCCSALVLLLSWVKSGSEAEAVTLPSKHNDARAAKRAPAAEVADARPEAAALVNDSATSASGPKSTAANDAPPAALAQQTTPSPAPPAAAAPKADEKARVETPAVEEGGNFTAQVGSHSDQSEANEQVSRLRAAGFDARAVTAELPGRGTWYRVQVGRYAERVEAAKTVAALRAKGAASGALVVPIQK